MTVATIEAALLACLEPIAGFGERIFVNRERPYESADLPCLEIRFTGEDSERGADHYMTWDASFALAVCVKAAEADRPDLAADALYQQVKARLYADMTLAGEVPRELEFAGGRPDVDAGGEFVVRKLVLDIKCQYTDELYGQATDALSTVAMGIDMGNPRNDPQLPAGPDGQIDAQITIDLPA